MTYYTTNSKYGAIHKIPTCPHLVRAKIIRAIELTTEQARKRRHCRFCFPEEEESTKEVQTK